jgi:hypothetical protein
MVPGGREDKDMLARVDNLSLLDLISRSQRGNQVSEPRGLVRSCFV